jgi:alpha-D-xyloside xylohydrolase
MDPAPTIPSEFLRTAGGKQGLDVRYFEGANFEKPAGKALEARVEHTWPGPPLAGPPPGLGGFDNFSGRWEGFVIAPEDGEHEIGVEADDGFRLWLDGQAAAEDWTLGPARYKGAKIKLRKGQKVKLKLEYFQAGGGRVLRLGWRTPSEFREFARRSSKLDLATETYLPAGAAWFDFWTQRRFQGGKSVRKDCPLDSLPLFVRAGSIVPMGPVIQYATEQPGAPYEIRVYPGADASFTLYEDDNETYRYEKGEFMTFELAWDERLKKLRIGPRKGSFPGMTLARELKVMLALPAGKSGSGEPSFESRSVVYQGQPLELDFK